MEAVLALKIATDVCHQAGPPTGGYKVSIIGMSCSCIHIQTGHTLVSLSTLNTQTSDIMF